MTHPARDAIARFRSVRATLLALAFFAPLSMGVRECEPVIVGDVCEYGGDRYDAGDTFKSTDGCNDCTCQADGSVACTERACVPQTCGGLQGARCPEDQYCDFAPDAQCGAADQTGECKTRPTVCTRIYKPVCGCDDKTYGNACEAAAAGVSVVKEGECKAPSSGCDYDGKHYEAGEGFPSSDGCNTCSCSDNGQVACTLRACIPQTCGGLQGKACPDKQYCDFAPEAMCGAADQTGTCKPIANGCTKIYKPVCGCDDKTYGNACMAAAAGVSVSKEGACEPAPDSSCGGLQGKACPDKQYCDFAPEAMCGAADHTGTCKARPDACPFIWAPVCGCDDKQYGNACEAAAAGISVSKQGPCENIDGRTCGGLGNLPCPANSHYCQYALDAQCGAADQTGTCQPLPTACDKSYKPVCGCNDRTYNNACEAAAAGVSVRKQDACETSGTTGCDYNGKHYQPGDSFPDADGCNTCSCQKDGQIACTLKACIAACGGLQGLKCKDGQYCSYRPEDLCGAADATGICLDKPQICTAIYDPVCGCNGKTYASECTAASEGIAISAKGECK